MTHLANMKYRMSSAAGQRWLWPVAIALSALAVAAVTFGGIAPALRPAIALWFLGFCPGMAFIRLLNVADGPAELTLAIALSLVLDSLVAGVSLYAGLWSPRATLLVLIALSLAGAALQVARPRPIASKETL